MQSLHRTNFTKQERREQLGPAYKGNLYRDANKGTMHPLSQTDLGHKKGYEERSVRQIAERAGFTQKEYDDMMKNSSKYTKDGETIYQSEYFKNNRSHKYEEHDALLSRHNGYIMVQNYRQAQKNGNTNVPRPGTENQQQKEGTGMNTQQNEESRKRRIPPDNDKEKQTQETAKPKTQNGRTAGKTGTQGKALGNCKGGNTPAGRAPASHAQSGGSHGQSSGGRGGNGGGGHGSGSGHGGSGGH